MLLLHARRVRRGVHCAICTFAFPTDKPAPSYLELAACARRHLLGAQPVVIRVRLCVRYLCAHCLCVFRSRYCFEGISFQPGEPWIAAQTSFIWIIGISPVHSRPDAGPRGVVSFTSAAKLQGINDMAQSTWKDYVLREKYIHPRKLKKILDEKYGPENYTVKVRLFVLCGYYFGAFLWPGFSVPTTDTVDRQGRQDTS